MPDNPTERLDKLSKYGRQRVQLMLLNLPDIPHMTVSRGYAGGFGVAGAFQEKLLPTYLLYAASAARNSGCSYHILDAQANNYGTAPVLDEVRRVAPNVLVSWISLPSIYEDLRLMTRIKEISPLTTTVGLGAVCNVMPEAVLTDSRLDMIIKGAYPYYKMILSLGTLLRDGTTESLYTDVPGATYFKDGKLISHPAEQWEEDLNALQLDAYYKIPIRQYLLGTKDLKGNTVKCLPLLTGIGCPYSCMYCPYPIGYGHKKASKSAARIIEEIEFLKNNFGVNGFLFRDQSFAQDIDRANEVCAELIRRDFHIRWYIESRVDQVSPAFLSKMKQAGCFRVHYGVETGSPTMLKTIGKPGVTIDMIKAAFRLTKEAGLATTAHMILGLPGENLETLESSFNLLCEIDPDSINLNLATPYPGTRLFEIAKQRNLIATYDWSEYLSHKAVMRTEELSIAELAQAKRRMNSRLRKYKLRNDPSFRRRYLRELPSTLKRYLWSFPGRGHF